MKFLTPFKKHLAYLLTAMICFMQISPAYAAMIGNDQLLRENDRVAMEQQLLTLLEKEDVIEQLEQLGVDSVSARERVKSMTEEEISILAEQMESLPAGSGVLGAILVVFIVFVITDMLGATDIFPFVKNINQ